MTPVTDLVATPHSSGLPVLELTWAHAGTADRFMLGFDVGDGWTNLPPAPVASFGAGPYAATVPALPDVDWRVLALDADGTVSS